MLYTKLGMNFTVFQKMEGQLYMGEGKELTDLFEVSPNPGPRIGISSGVGVGYHASDKIQLVFYPQANLGLNTIFYPDVAIKQREFGIFTNVGIRMNL